MGKSTGMNPQAARGLAGSKTQNPHFTLPRATVHDFDDPYIPDQHFEDGTVCSQCGAIYRNQHWQRDESASRTLIAAGTPHQVVCPGCRKIADHDPQGIVTLRGDYWPQHRDEILNLIRHEEQRGTHTNPLERVMDIREEEGSLVIETTNEKLAQRIGRQIHKAHHGHVDYRWSDTNHLVRVYWERELNGKG